MKTLEETVKILKEEDSHEKHDLLNYVAAGLFILSKLTVIISLCVMFSGYRTATPILFGVAGIFIVACVSICIITWRLSNRLDEKDGVTWESF